MVFLKCSSHRFVLVLALSLIVAACLAIGSGRSVHAQTTPFFADRVDVLFEIEAVVPAGQAACVAGDLAELGGADYARCILMYNAGGNLWRARISLPRGVPFWYRYGRRLTSNAQLTNGNNFTPLGDQVETQLPLAQPNPRRFVSIAHPSPYNKVQVIDHRGQVREERTLINQGARDVALGLLLARGQTVRVLGTGVGPVDFQTNTPWLYLDATLQAGTWMIPPHPPSAPRYAVHTGFASPQLGNSRSVRVYLPRGYDQHPERRYPVVYFFDGQSIFDGAYGGQFGSWKVDATMTPRTARGEWPEVIGVGIDSLSNQASRGLEYTPPPDFFRGTLGRGDRTMAFLIDTVAPFIESNYRVHSDPRHRAVTGSSLGGVMAAYVVWERPDFATTAFCMSPAFWIAGNLINRFATETPRDVTFYFDAGNKAFSYFEYSTPDDGQQTALAARLALMQRGTYVLERNLFHVYGYGDGHSEPTWGRRFLAAWPRVMGDHRRAHYPLDVNGDGVYNIADLVTLINGAPLPQEVRPRADLDGSGTVDALDAMALEFGILGIPGWE